MNLSQVTASKLPALIWQNVKSTDGAGYCQGKVLAFNGPSLLGSTYSMNHLCPSTMMFSLIILFFYYLFKIFKRLYHIRDICHWKSLCLNGLKYSICKEHKSGILCQPEGVCDVLSVTVLSQLKRAKLMLLRLYQPHTEIKRLFFHWRIGSVCFWVAAVKQTRLCLHTVLIQYPWQHIILTSSAILSIFTFAFRDWPAPHDFSSF